VARGNPRQGTSTVRASKAGFEPAFPMVAKYPTSSPPASVEPPSKRQTGSKNSSAALSTRRPLRTPGSSLCHRYPAHRLVPSGRPRALGPRAFPREPRDPGLPFRPSPVKFQNEPCFGQQKTLRSGWLGRVRQEADYRCRLREIAPMSRACAIDQRNAGRSFDEHFVSAVHCLTHVFRKPYCSRGRGKYARASRMSIRVPMKLQQCVTQLTRRLRHRSPRRMRSTVRWIDRYKGRIDRCSQ
jgi:hypothetical protein